MSNKLDVFRHRGRLAEREGRRRNIHPEICIPGHIMNKYMTVIVQMGSYLYKITKSG